MTNGSGSNESRTKEKGRKGKEERRKAKESRRNGIIREKDVASGGGGVRRRGRDERIKKEKGGKAEELIHGRKTERDLTLYDQGLI